MARPKGSKNKKPKARQTAAVIMLGGKYTGYYHKTTKRG